MRGLLFLFPESEGSSAEPAPSGDTGLKKFVQERVVIYFLFFRGSLGKCASAPWKERAIEVGKKFWEEWECGDLQEMESVAAAGSAWGASAKRGDLPSFRRLAHL